jgi:hypothetical protein
LKPITLARSGIRITRKGIFISTDQPWGVRATADSQAASQSVVASVSLKWIPSSCCPAA